MYLELKCSFQTNEPRHSQSGMIYSNLMHSSRDGRNVYSNLPTDYPGYPNGGKKLIMLSTKLKGSILLNLDKLYKAYKSVLFWTLH